MIRSSFYVLLVLSVFLASCSNQKDIEESNTLPSLMLFHSSINTLDLTGIEIIDGPLHLVNTDAKDLSFLSGIKEVRGKIEIANNEDLESLFGLENLQFVETINIRLNKNLRNVSSLRDVQIEKALHLVQNGIEQVPVFNGLANPSIEINIDEPMESLEIISSIESASNIRVVDSKLVDLADFKNLKEIDKLTIQANALLEDYCEIKTLLVENESIELDFKGNRFNPTKEEIIAQCE
ncbi:MAG: hypothetical protein AAGA77_00995 [Bacteroidota bacterium]